MYVVVTDNYDSSISEYMYVGFAKAFAWECDMKSRIVKRESAHYNKRCQSFPTRRYPVRLLTKCLVFLHRAFEYSNKVTQRHYKAVSVRTRADIYLCLVH